MTLVGLEPTIFAVKGRCPSRLDDRAFVMQVGIEPTISWFKARRATITPLHNRSPSVIAVALVCFVVVSGLMPSSYFNYIAKIFIKQW